MKRLNASVAREEFSELLNQVSYLGERIIVQRRGRMWLPWFLWKTCSLSRKLKTGWIMPPLTPPLRRPGESIPWEQVKKDLSIQ